MSKSILRANLKVGCFESQARGQVRRSYGNANDNIQFDVNLFNDCLMIASYRFVMSENKRYDSCAVLG